jgi:hypothetical protein
LAATKVYTDQKKMEVELGSLATLETLLEDFIEAARSVTHA